MGMKNSPIMVSFKLLTREQKYLSVPNLSHVAKKNHLIKCSCFLILFQVYGFPVNQLFDMLLEIRDQYSETLLKKWAGIFR